MSKDYDAVIAAGTLDGHVVVIDTSCAGGRALGAVRHFGHVDSDHVLGLCWLGRDSTRFVAGTASGSVRLVDAGSVMRGVANGEPPEHLPVRATFPRFINRQNALHSLTSVHVNAGDSRILLSGYSSRVEIIDMETGRLERCIENACNETQDGHINISRFAHQNPSLFATSAIDKRVSLWDLRLGRGGDVKPVYAFETARGNVTLSFDPSDTMLLTAGVDNEVSLHLVADGRMALRLDVEETGRLDSYSRAYFGASGSEIVSGCSEEAVVRVHSTSTGGLLSTVELFDGRPSNTLFVQSLRAHPVLSGRIGVLTHSKDPQHTLQMVMLDRLSHSADSAETSHSSMYCRSWTPTDADPSVAAFLGPTPLHAFPQTDHLQMMWKALAACLDDGAKTGGVLPPTSNSGADLTLLTAPVDGGARVRASVHAEVASARSPLLRQLLAQNLGARALALDEAFCCTPAMLSVLVSWIYTDSFLPPLPPPLKRCAALESTEDILLRLIGISIAEANSAGLAALDAQCKGASIVTRAADSRDLSESVPLLASARLFSDVGAGASEWFGPLSASSVRSGRGGRRETDALVAGSPWLLVSAIDPFRSPYSDNAETSTYSPHKSDLRAWRGFSGGFRERGEHSASTSEEDGPSSASLTSDEVLWVPGAPGFSVSTATATSPRPATLDSLLAPAGTPIFSREERVLQSVAVAFQTARVFRVPRLAFLAVSRLVCGAKAGSELTMPLMRDILQLAIAFGADATLSVSRVELGEDVADVLCRAIGQLSEKYMCELMHRSWVTASERASLGTADAFNLTAGAATCLLVCAMHFALQHAPLLLGILPDLRSTQAPGLTRLSLSQVATALGRLCVTVMTRPQVPVQVDTFQLAPAGVPYRAYDGIDPLTMSKVAPFAASCFMNSLILVGTPTFSRILVVGGITNGDDASALPLRSMLSLTVPTCSDEHPAFFKQSAGNAGSFGVPSTFSRPVAAPFTPGMPRFVVVFPGHADLHTDVGPGSVPRYASPKLVNERVLGGAAFSADSSTAHMRTSIPEGLSPVVALAAANSRVFVIDTLTGSCTTLSPLLDTGGSLEDNQRSLESFTIAEISRFRADLKHSASAPILQNVVAKISSELPCPTPRTGFSMTLWETRPIQEAGGETYLHHVVYGGQARAQFFRAFQDVGENLLHFLDDVRVLTTTTKSIGPRQTSICEWSQPTIRGTSVKRMGHAAEMVTLPDEEGGPVLVVHGGCVESFGPRRVSSQLRILALDGICEGPQGLPRRLSFEWCEPIVFGAEPSNRFGHKLVSLHSSSSASPDRTLALFGGHEWPTDLPPNNACLNGLHILTVAKANGTFVCTWSTPIIEGPQPSPREYAGLVYAPTWTPSESAVPGIPVPGAVILFGGRGRTRAYRQPRNALNSIDDRLDEDGNRRAPAFSSASNRGGSVERGHSDSDNEDGSEEEDSDDSEDDSNRDVDARRVFVLHLSLEQVSLSDKDMATRKPSVGLQMGNAELRLFARPVAVHARWSIANPNTFSAAGQPVPPVPSSMLASDLLSLVPGGRLAANLNAPVDEDLERTITAEVKRGRREGGSSDFLLRLAQGVDGEAHVEIPSFSWLLRESSPLFAAVLAADSLEEFPTSSLFREGRARQMRLQLAGHADDVTTSDTETISVTTCVRLLASITTGHLFATSTNPLDTMLLMQAAERLGFFRVASAAEASLVSCVSDESALGFLAWLDTSFPRQFEMNDRALASPRYADRLRGALRSHSVIGHMLYAACISHTLRNFDKLQSAEDWESLSSEIRDDVLAERAREGHAYRSP